MAVPSSGTLSMKGIFSEKNENDYTAANMDGESGLSLRGLSSNSYSDTSTGGNINLNSASGSNPPNQTAPYSMSEFYSYDHDYSAITNFVWGSSTSTVPSAYFQANAEDTGDGGSHAVYVGTRIDVTWFSTYMRIAYEDFFGSATSTSNITSQSSNVDISFTGSTQSVSYVQARWRIIDGSYVIDTGSSNKILGLFKTNGHNVTDSNDTTTQVIRSGTQGDGTNIDFTGSYVTITPSAYNGTVLQSFGIQAETIGDDDQARLRLTASGDSIQLEIRVVRTDGSGTTHTIQKPYVSSTNPNLQSTSFDIPSFTCIMPDMLVLSDTGWKRIGDVVVGDRILAQGDLNNLDVDPIYVDINEARTHTRGGYWDVGGIHITNDHPVWLTDETGSEWVTVENMRDGIARTYVDGTVDPVYLGTNPGHYYVFSEDKQKVFTVSGDYAPTTE